jgi:hypothetical protein
MIYHTRLFYNELELLYLQVDECEGLSDYQQVIVESDKTFQDKPIIPTFNAGWHHTGFDVCRVAQPPWEMTPFDREHYARDVSLAYCNLQNDDILIHTDIDEIIHRDDIRLIQDLCHKHGYIKIGMEGYCYYINARSNYITAPFAATGKFIKESGISCSNLRRSRDKNGVKGQLVFTMRSRGRHFSFLDMDAAAISNKFKSYSHHQRGSTPVEEIQRAKKSLMPPVVGDDKLVIVDIDENYPTTILNNREYWSRYEYKK